MNEHEETEKQLPKLVGEFTKQLPQSKTDISNHDKQWPTTVDEAVGKILQVLNEKDKEKIKNYHNKWNMATFHFTLGMWIRNEFGIGGGNSDLMASIKEGHPDKQPEDEIMTALRQSGHPDNASAVILLELWEVLRP
jgi:hypothetical protein